jgi:CRP-like cAMP-binding protein
MKVDKDDVIYCEGDFAEEIYFIKSGKIKLYAKNGFPFASYKEGQHFGDPEVLILFNTLFTIDYVQRDKRWQSCSLN